MVCPLLPMEDQKMGRMDGARWVGGSPLVCKKAASNVEPFCQRSTGLIHPSWCCNSNLNAFHWLTLSD